MTSHRSRLIPLAKFLISGTAIWYLASSIDVADMGERLLNIAPQSVVYAGLLILIQYVICAFRWRRVLSAIGTPLPWLILLRVFVIGTFFNQTLPSSVGGDAVRVVMTRRAGLRWGEAVNGVMLERLAIVAAIPLVALASLPWFLPGLEEDMAIWMVVGVVALTIAMVTGIGFLAMLEQLPSAVHRWRLLAGIAALGGDSRRIFLTWRHAPPVFAWSMIGHANISFMVFVLAGGMGLDVAMADCLALVPLVLLATTIPLSIGGWGFREGAMVFGFGLVGVPEAGAFGLSVLTGLMGILLSLPGGVAWLVTRDRQVVVEAAEPGVVAGATSDVAAGGR